MRVSFDKMQGLGNDFIVIEDLADEIHLSEGQVIALCDRNFGIGADGVIIMRRSTLEDADFAWWFANADGSIAEMCGNGIRCAVRALLEWGLIPADASHVAIETSTGVRKVEIEIDEEGVFEYATVDMGSADLNPSAIGVALEPNTALEIEFGGDSGDDPDIVEAPSRETLSVEGVIDYPLTIDQFDRPIEITCLSMGNPHTVIDLRTLGCSIAGAPVEEIGPAIEMHPAFGNRTNVAFIEVVDENTLNVRVWERGCGETLACGTGACAAAVSAYLHGLVCETLTVQLPGGDLSITIDPATLGVRMAGPAYLVYAGTIGLDE